MLILVPLPTTITYYTAGGGTVVYAYTYTGCDGATQTWTFTYTVTPPTWAVSADGTATVACAAEAVAPAVPDVYDNCGRLIPVTLPQTSTYDTACGGTVVYAYTYTGCDGATQTWTFTYTVTSQKWPVATDGTSMIACAAEAVAPAVPDVYGNCGRL